MYKFEFMACLLKVTSQHGNLHTHTPFATKTHTHTLKPLKYLLDNYNDRLICSYIIS